MAFDEPSLVDVLKSDDRYDVYSTLLELLSRSLRPTVVVIEDVHWADEATLDLIKFLGRRIDRTHGLLLLTYRDGEVAGDHPLRIALGDLPSGLVERVSLEPLTIDAVAELAGKSAEKVWQVTEGNPFFVTEVLAGDGDSVPGSIRDSIRGKLLRLDEDSRHLVELVSVFPSRAELAVLEGLTAELGSKVGESEEAGILEVRGDSVAFRHELARRAVESDLPQIRRRELNLAVLAVCEADGSDISRCAHHALEAGDPDAIMKWLPSAARRAAELESHHESVQHLRRLEPYLDRLDISALANHYDLWAYEEYLLSGASGRDMVEKAISLRRELGDDLKLGNSLLVASRIAWVESRRASAIEYANEAASVMESVGGEALARAYSALSQLAMLGSEVDRTIWYGEKALAVAGEGPSEARAHALNNIGTVISNERYPEGLAELQESYRMSVDLGLSHDSTRAAVNISWNALMWRDPEAADPWIERGIELSSEREMPSFESYVQCEKAMSLEMRGDWDGAETIATDVLGGQWEMETSLATASVILGRIKSRRGAPDAKTMVLQAWEKATTADEVQRLGPAAALLAELAWLGGDVDDSLLRKIKAVMGECLEHGSLWHAGDIFQWLLLGGQLAEAHPGLPEPYALLGKGKWQAASHFWGERGIPYEKAVALSLGDEASKFEALSILDRLGATPLAARVRSELVDAGVKGVPRGPSKATKESPLGLTPRQAEVVALLAEGLTNAQIADRLFVSNRTVDHHVSAILSKLNAGSRAEAVEAARDAGLVA
jgi:DNA-binding CsgD family transcriptional regulator